MDVNEIRQLLPHGYPFLLVDRILEFEENRRILGLKNVTFNEPVFQGHFPGRPVLPGVMIVEALAQVSGVLAFKSRGRTLDDGYAYYLAGTDNTRFKRSVVPGDQLHLEVEVQRFRKHWMKAEGRALVAGELVCSTLVTCAEQKIY